jgi:iron complex transport system substrate-binding protein
MVLRAFFLLLFFLTAAAFGKERVVSLSPALTDTVVFVGAADQLVGVTRFCDLPLCFRLPKVGGIVDPNLEAVYTLKPTLILATNLTPKRYVSALKGLGLRVVTFRLVSLNDLENAVERVGDLLKGNGKESLKRFEEELHRSLFRLNCLKGKQVVLLMGRTAPFVAGGDSYLGEILKGAGVKVVPKGTFRPVSLEFVLSLRPDLVVGFSDKACNLVKELGLKCVRFKEVSDLLHPSPRVIKGVRELGEEVCK